MASMCGMCGIQILGPACCWYTVFNWCGCIDAEREEIHTQQPQVQVQAPNPFLTNGLPKDLHLQQAYR